MNLNWAHSPLSRLVAMAFLPTQRGPKRQKDRITGNPQPCLRAHNVERGRVRDDIGLGTSVIRGSHQGSQSPFIPGRSTQFKPSHLHFTCWDWVDILADTVQSYFTNSVLTFYLRDPTTVSPMLGAISISTQVTRNPLPSYLQEITELWKGIFQVNFDNTDSFTFKEVMPGFCIRLLSFCQ